MSHYGRVEIIMWGEERFGLTQSEENDGEVEERTGGCHEEDEI